MVAGRVRDCCCCWLVALRCAVTSPLTRLPLKLLMGGGGEGWVLLQAGWTAAARRSTSPLSLFPSMARGGSGGEGGGDCCCLWIGAGRLLSRKVNTRLRKVNTRLGTGDLIHAAEIIKGKSNRKPERYSCLTENSEQSKGQVMYVSKMVPERFP